MTDRHAATRGSPRTLPREPHTTVARVVAQARAWTRHAAARLRRCLVAATAVPGRCGSPVTTLHRQALVRSRHTRRCAPAPVHTGREVRRLRLRHAMLALETGSAARRQACSGHAQASRAPPSTGRAGATTTIAR